MLSMMKIANTPYDVAIQTGDELSAYKDSIEPDRGRLGMLFGPHVHLYLYEQVQTRKLGALEQRTQSRLPFTN